MGEIPPAFGREFEERGLGRREITAENIRIDKAKSNGSAKLRAPARALAGALEVTPRRRLVVFGEGDPPERDPGLGRAPGAGRRPLEMAPRLPARGAAGIGDGLAETRKSVRVLGRLGDCLAELADRLVAVAEPQVANAELAIALGEERGVAVRALEGRLIGGRGVAVTAEGPQRGAAADVILGATGRALESRVEVLERAPWLADREVGDTEESVGALELRICRDQLAEHCDRLARAAALEETLGASETFPHVAGQKLAREVAETALDSLPKRHD